MATKKQKPGAAMRKQIKAHAAEAKAKKSSTGRKATAPSAKGSVSKTLAKKAPTAKKSAATANVAKERKAKLCEVAGELAAKFGSSNVTRRMVAKAADVSDSLVGHYLGTAEAIKKAAVAACRKAGLKEPTKEQQVAIGQQLRAHGPRDAKPQRRAEDQMRRESDKFGRRAEDKKNLGRRATDRKPLPPPPPPAPPAPLV